MNPRGVRLSLSALWLISFSLCAEPKVELGTLNKQVAKFPLKNEGPHFLNYGVEFKVDPRLIVAIAGIESTYGKHLCADFNAWNWFWAGNCPDSDFESFERGIRTVSKFMRKAYFLTGYTTIERIHTKYCPADCAGWDTAVTKFYRDEMGGDTSDLGYSDTAVVTIPGTPAVKPTPKSTPKAPSTKKTDPTAPEEPEESWWERIPWFVPALGALALLAAGAVALVVKLRRKPPAPAVKTELPPVAVETPAGAAPPASPAVPATPAVPAAPAVSVSPSVIPAGEPTPITITAHIPGQLQPSAVTLMRVDAQGVPQGVIGSMQRDAGGTGYSLRTTLHEASTGTVLFQVWSQYSGRGGPANTVCSNSAAVAVGPKGVAFDIPDQWAIEGGAAGELRLASLGAAARIEIASMEMSGPSIEAHLSRDCEGKSVLKREQTLAGVRVTCSDAAGLTMVSLYAPNNATLYRFRLTHPGSDAKAPEYGKVFERFLNTVRYT